MPPTAALHTDVDGFWAAAHSIYEADPVAFTVELTLLRGDMSRYHNPVFLTVDDDDVLVGAALWTPPLPLLCNGLTPATVVPAVQTLAELAVPAVRGRRDLADVFASAWTSATATTATVKTEERLYRLETLVAPAADGAARQATYVDIDVVAAWVDEFHVTEFGDRSNPSVAAENVRVAMAAGNQYFLWERDGTPVSLAAVRAPVASMTRIGPVFTPVALRGNGYGSAVTAAAAAWGRAAGADEVVLFTDLENPVSNRIYQRLGFRAVSDWARIDFTL